MPLGFASAVLFGLIVAPVLLVVRLFRMADN